MTINLESLTSFILGRVSNKSTEQKGPKVNNSIFEEDANVQDTVGDIFRRCDADGNGTLEGDEVSKATSLLGKYGEFGGLTVANLEKGFKLRQAEKNAQTLIQNDENISSELRARKLKNDNRLNQVQTLIDELVGKQNNLTPEEKTRLEELQAEKEELLAERDELEAEILKTGSKETQNVIKDLIEQRKAYAQEEQERLEALNLDAEETPVNNTNGATRNNATNPFNYRGGVSGSPYANTSYGNNPLPKTIENMSLDELKAEKSKAEGELTTSQGELTEILNGTNKELVGLQKNIDTSKETYTKLLQEVAPELAQQLNEQLGKKTEMEGTINQTELDISNTDNTVKTLTATITSLTGKISSYQGSIASLEAANLSELTPEKQAEIRNRIAELKREKAAAEAEKVTAEGELNLATAKLEKLRGDLAGYKEQLGTINDAIKETQGKIDQLNNKELTKAQKDYNDAVSEFDKRKESLKSEVEAQIQAKQAEIDKIQKQIDIREQKSITRKGSINSLDDPEGLYVSMGLEELGLSRDAFLNAINGYNNLSDAKKAESGGRLVIVDNTAQGRTAGYYMLDLNTFEVVATDTINRGSGNSNNMLTANQYGSHATLSGFMQVGDEYFSSSMGKSAMRIHGLEQGINDNAFNKGVVAHWSKGRTWGCFGFSPVYRNGYVDNAATNQRMRELFPSGAIIYSHATDSRYEDMSSLA